MKTKIIICLFFGIILSLRINAQTLDQSYLTTNSGMSARYLPGYSHWQSFTAGITGTLTQIDLGFFTAISGVGTLEIYAGSGVGGALLQTETVSVTCGGGNCLISCPTSLTVTSGQVYTFHFIPGAGMPDPYGVQVQIPGTYAGGEFALVDPSGTYLDGWDMVFQTWVNGAVDVSEINNDNTLTLFPNPAKGELTVNSEQLTVKGIRIFNLLGQVVYQSESASTKTIINTSALPAGIYTLQINNGTAICMKKFVIER